MLRSFEVVLAARMAKKPEVLALIIRQGRHSVLIRLLGYLMRARKKS